MDLREYQEAAGGTDQRPGSDLRDVAVHLLGLAGEAGSVAAQYKKKLRDQEAHQTWKAQMREELGDVLWYVAALASHFELDLSEIAEANLEKTRNRWLPTSVDQLDIAYPAGERLPRQGSYEFASSLNAQSRPTVTIHFEGQPCGDPLTDASRVDDGYRFHDVFHLSYATVLGWSPVTRSLLKRKRRSDASTDEAEDGGRSIVLEEAISSIVFSYAANHDFLCGVNRLDQHLLDTIQMVVGGTEVGVRSAADWERAILTGFEMWRHLRHHDGGTVFFDADTREMTYRPTPE